MGRYVKTNELYHHGIKGQKWGVRRFQKVGGGLTPAGKKRYSKDKDPNKVRAKKHAKLKGEDRRAQMEALSKRTDIKRKDRKIAKKGAASTNSRVVSTLVKESIKDVVGSAALSALTGINIKSTKRDVAVNSLLTYMDDQKKIKRLSEAYNPDGTGKKNRMPAIKRNVAKVALFAATATTAAAAVTAAKNEYVTEKRMKEWGDNILAAKYDSIVPISESEYRVSD